MLVFNLYELDAGEAAALLILSFIVIILFIQFIIKMRELQKSSSKDADIIKSLSPSPCHYCKYRRSQREGFIVVTCSRCMPKAKTQFWNLKYDCPVEKQQAYTSKRMRYLTILKRNFEFAVVAFFIILIILLLVFRK